MHLNLYEFLNMQFSHKWNFEGVIRRDRSFYVFLEFAQIWLDIGIDICVVFTSYVCEVTVEGICYIPVFG